jgi:hypothetical protein
LDTINVVYDKHPAGGVNPMRSLATTRAYEIGLDALPQVWYQAQVLVQLEYKDRSTLLWGSLMFSALSVSYLVSTFEVDIDTSVNYRALFARFHGYMPDDQRQWKAVVLGIIMFISGSLIGKVTALSVLGVGAPVYMGIWLLAECTVLWVLRALSEGTVRFQVPGLDSTVGSLVVQALLYVFTLGAPTPFLRFPGYLGPTLYLPWVLYLMGANIVMIVVGLELDREQNNIQIDTERVYLVFATSVSLSVLGFGLMMGCMNPSRRSSFFGRLSLRDYISELWDVRTYAPIGEGLDASRAHLLKFSKHYWPTDARLLVWLEENWEVWSAKPPSWFKARAMRRVETSVALEVLPLLVLKKVAEKQAEKLASGDVNSKWFSGITKGGGDPDSSPRFGAFADASREELVAMVKKQRGSMAVAHAKKVWIWFTALIFSYADLISTVFVALQFLSLGDKGREGANITLGLLAVSLVVQVWFTWWSAQGTLATLATMCGGKPLWDTYHIIFKVQTKGWLHTEAQLTATRGMQVVFDSLPQAVAQMVLVSQIDTTEQFWTMAGSIAGCIASIAYLVVTTELDIDTSPSSYTNWPTVHGYMPTDSRVRETLVILGILFFISGILGAKLIAITALTSASITVTVGWFTAEFVALFVLRYFAEGRIWRVHLRGLSGPGATFIFAIFIYLAMEAAPFPFLRFPGYCGPLPYSVSIIYNLVINPIMVYTAFYLGGSQVMMMVSSQYVWIGLAIATGVAFLGMVMMGCGMNANRRSTFYKPLPMRNLLNKMWDERNVGYLSDGYIFENNVDPSRGMIIKFHHEYVETGC